MSHWSTGKTTVKNLDLLEKVAKNLGVNVTRAQEGRKLQLRSSYAGVQEADMLLEYNGGVAGVVEVDGGYAVTLDNWGNPIVEKIGHSGATLSRDYQTEVTKQQALLLGGMVASCEVAKDGYVDVEIHVP